jgi:hypothetical protein
VPIVGACGTVVAVMADVKLDAVELPTPFTATTLKVYAVADCNPVTVIGVVVFEPVYDPGFEVAT